MGPPLASAVRCEVRATAKRTDTPGRLGPPTLPDVVDQKSVTGSDSSMRSGRLFRTLLTSVDTS